jgi:dipeptidyl aminopeptidase/acylaminoacyl peptidase
VNLAFECVSKIQRVARVATNLIAQVVVMLVIAGSVLGAALSPTATIDDYFSIHRIVESALSPDGSRLAYITRRTSLSKNKSILTLYVISLTGAEPTLIRDDLEDARQLAWIANQKRIAFISDRLGIGQVVSLDLTGDAVFQWTDAPNPVVAFRFSPLGNRLAYITNEIVESRAHLLHVGTAGVIADPDLIEAWEFLDPNWNRSPMQRSKLWVRGTGTDPILVQVPGDTREVRWSPTAQFLSVSYVSFAMGASLLRDLRTSVGIVDSKTLAFYNLFDGHHATGDELNESYSGGEWVPHHDQLVIRRVIDKNAAPSPTTRGKSPSVPWNFPEWAIVDASRDNYALAKWHPIEALSSARWIPIDPQRIFVEDAQRAVSTVRVVTGDVTKIASVITGLGGSSFQFQFSRDLKISSFVNESLTRPPEIYVRTSSSLVPRRVTDLNGIVTHKSWPSARELTWTSSDGQSVSGWLLEPREDQFPRPWPLVTFIHGGPDFAYRDSFAPYFDIWPYPLEIYAQAGIAVFVPNYRGSTTFGRRFESPSDVDAEPVDDILSGIDYLKHADLADGRRLGISGHSHGVWLGMTIMTHKNIFRASSFADGVQNVVVAYELVNRGNNEEFNDMVLGASLYETPSRYIDLSPDLHFAGLRSANLMEAGAKTAGLTMIGAAKASRRAGLPTEFIIYPNTGHNIGAPRLARESAIRNLDWFRFWLEGVEDPEPNKGAQYERWRAYRDDACTRDERLPYCGPSPIKMAP